MATVPNKTAVKSESSVEFVPFGANDKIRLTASMVRQFIAVPTKSGALPSERDCIRFIMLCRGKRANPFEGDCFLIGYDSQNGPSFSLVCGLELFLKRAEQCAEYDGRESGVIVATDAAIVERPGSFYMPESGEKLVGGWAKVYRKDRAHPEYKTVKFSTYDTGRSRWQKDPAGMIEKVALSQALRSAFPTALGGLYTQEEMQRVTEAGDGVVASIAEPIAMPKVLPASGEAPVQPEPSAPHADDDGQSQEAAVVEVEVGEIKSKNGGTKDKPWTRYFFKYGEDYYSTFDEKLAEILRGLVGTRRKVRIKRTEKGINIIGIESESQEQQEQLGQSGDADDLFLNA